MDFNERWETSYIIGKLDDIAYDLSRTAHSFEFLGFQSTSNIITGFKTKIEEQIRRLELLKI